MDLSERISSEKMVFEQRPVGGKGVIVVDIWTKSFQAVSAKISEEGTCLLCLRKSKEIMWLELGSKKESECHGAAKPVHHNY